MTVIIGGDDDLPDALTEIPAPLTGGGDGGGDGRSGRDRGKDRVDPRMRKRRIDVLRGMSRRRLWWIVGIVGGLAVVLVPLIVLTSSMFDIETVEVSGADATSEAALAPIIEDLRGEPILTADLNAARARLERLPYVKSAVLATDFPHRLEIQLDERSPLAAYAGNDGKWHVIDRDARVLAVVAQSPARVVPIISSHSAVEAGGQAPAELLPLTTLLLAVPDELEAWVDTVRVAPTGETTIVLRSGTILSVGQAGDRPQTKIAVALQILRQVGPNRLKSVDVTNPDLPKQVKR